MEPNKYHRNDQEINNIVIKYLSCVQFQFEFILNAHDDKRYMDCSLFLQLCKFFCEIQLVYRQNHGKII